MATYTLTQKLYALEEVVLALLTSLLKKKDLNECYYWLNEIYLSVSETELRKRIGQIYYDFYYTLNPTVESVLPSMDIKLLIAKLFHLDNSPLVFILCHAVPVKPTYVYITKNQPPAAWLVKDARLHNFMRAVTKTHYDGICYHAHKLLRNEGVTGEELVKALGFHFKKAFIEKVPSLMRDDFHYVMLAYAKLHAERRTPIAPLAACDAPAPVARDAPAPVARDAPYSIPPTIAGFKLQRWQVDYGATCGAIDRLKYDPTLIAFGLAMKESTDLTGLFRANANYIREHLNAEEAALFTGMPAAEVMQSLVEEHYADIVSEQRAKQHLWLQKYATTNLVERVPSFGAAWLRELYPTLDAKLMSLIKYKMFDTY